MVDMFPKIIDRGFSFSQNRRRSNIGGIMRLNPAAAPPPVQPSNHGMQQTAGEVNMLNTQPFATRSAFGRQDLSEFINKSSLVNYGSK